MTHSRVPFAFKLAAVLLAITAIPYLFGALTSPSGTSFAWAVGFLPDTMGNLALSRQAMDGAFLFQNPYTAEAHPARIVSPLFWITGLLQRLTGIGPGPAFQAVRLLCCAAFVFSLCAACAFWFPREKERRTACLLACFTGGLGFLAWFFEWFNRSADIRGAEMTTFFSLYQQAHFAASLALIIWCVRFLSFSFVSGSTRPAWYAGMAHLALASIHPYDIPITSAAAILAGLTGASLGRFHSGRSTTLALVIFLLLPAPLLAYYWHLTHAVPVYREFAREGLLAPAWPMLDYLLGFAPLLPLAILGFRDVLRRRDPGWLMIAAWVIAVPLLLALPFPARRKLLEGQHLMLALLAARGLFLTGNTARVPWRSLSVAILAISSLSCVYVMTRDAYAIHVARQPERWTIRRENSELLFPFHGVMDRAFHGSDWLAGVFLHRVDRYDLPSSLLKALSWMSAELEPGSLVFAAPETGLLIPVYTRHRVLAGHLFETLRYREKCGVIAAVMSGSLPDGGRRALVRNYEIDFILLDDRLERLGRWRPGARKWVKKRAQFGAIELWEIVPEKL